MQSCLVRILGYLPGEEEGLIIYWLKQLFCRHKYEINGFLGMYQCQKCAYIPKFIRNKLLQKYIEEERYL